MQTRAVNINIEKTIFWTLVAGLFLSLGLYMYFINTTVHNVVSLQNLEAEAGRLTLSIGSKEFDYISKRNAVTLELAYSMGFNDAEVKTFISRRSDSKVAVLAQ